MMSGDFKVTKISDVIIFEPSVFKDERGFFFENYNEREFSKYIGESVRFVQDSHSKSTKGILRGLHYQNPEPQGKIVRVVSGKVLDVTVDIRKSSKTFGEHFTIELTAEKHQCLWIPAGCAHGFFVLSESAELQYKCTNYYYPENEQCIYWNDPYLAIDWHLNGTEVKLSKKDRKGVSFQNAVYFP